jgi:fructan beta-fructosidase
MKLQTLLLLLTTLPVAAQFYPHPDTTDYKEDYRAQFHFSPQTEWMNDINGLVYQGGKYHMIYQWAESVRGKREWKPRFGGYATSKDLLRWEDNGVALIPQRDNLWEGAESNVTGCEVYSGSAVVIEGEVAKKITGSEKEAIVAIYTGKCVGTCLAWSNDVGETWHDYPGNPVAHPVSEKKPDYPRDPCVIWHEESKKFILALYKDGTTFYGSKDLIKWDSLSNMDFGYECPDLVQLPLDGDENNKKWVIYDANGSYLLGQFDGTHFKTDPGQETHIMDVGPDFYAAQTFPAGNLPDNDPRIIQIAWMDHWNGGVGEKYWERNATFPVSLGLVTLNGQMSLTRHPINEIETLYKNSKKWENLVADNCTDPLEGINSKTFDLTIEVDLNETTANSFGIRVANKTIEYYIPNNTLLEKELLPDKDNKLKIRILVDWAQLEIFAADGVFSYTQQFGFTPNRNDVSFFSDDKIKIDKMEFHEIKSIW